MLIGTFADCCGTGLWLNLPTMPQMLLPLFHEGTQLITPVLGYRREGNEAEGHSNPSKSGVLTLTDLGAPAGLGSPASQSVSGIGAYFAQPNQITTAISIASLLPGSAIIRPGVSPISPISAIRGPSASFSDHELDSPTRARIPWKMRVSLRQNPQHFGKKIEPA